MSLHYNVVLVSDCENEKEEMGWMSGHNSVLPFTTMIIVECVNLGSGVFFKAAASRGLSYYVLIVYSHAIAIFRRTGLPPFKLSLIFNLFLLRIIGFLGSLCGYKGIEYSSPTLACFSYWEPISSFYLHTCHNLQYGKTELEKQKHSSQSDGYSSSNIRCNRSSAL